MYLKLGMTWARTIRLVMRSVFCCKMICFCHEKPFKFETLFITSPWTKINVVSRFVGWILSVFLLWWQLLKLMYQAPVTAGYHQSTWSRIGRTVNPVIQRYAPFLNTPVSAVQRWWFRWKRTKCRSDFWNLFKNKNKSLAFNNKSYFSFLSA